MSFGWAVSAIESWHSAYSYWPSAATEPVDEFLIVGGVAGITAADIEDVRDIWEWNAVFDTGALRGSPLAGVVVFDDRSSNSHDNIDGTILVVGMIGNSRGGIISRVILELHIHLPGPARTFCHCGRHSRMAQRT